MKSKRGVYVLWTRCDVLHTHAYVCKTKWTCIELHLQVLLALQTDRRYQVHYLPAMRLIKMFKFDGQDCF